MFNSSFFTWHFHNFNGPHNTVTLHRSNYPHSYVTPRTATKNSLLGLQPTLYSETFWPSTDLTLQRNLQFPTVHKFLSHSKTHTAIIHYYIFRIPVECSQCAEFLFFWKSSPGDITFPKQFNDEEKKGEGVKHLFERDTSKGCLPCIAQMGAGSEPTTSVYTLLEDGTCDTLMLVQCSNNLVTKSRVIIRFWIHEHSLSIVTLLGYLHYTVSFYLRAVSILKTL